MNPTQALIAIIEEVRGGMSAECTSEGCTCGDGWSHDDPDLLARLDVAIKAAKAAEDGVETKYRVDVSDRIGWVMTTYDRFHFTEEAASARADRAFKSAEPVGSVRIVRIETRETVIEVREKEGL